MVKVQKKYEKKVQICKARVGPQMVSRSQSTLIRRSPIPIRNCFVEIRPNFHALCLQWLKRTEPTARTLQITAQNGTSETNEAGPSNQATQRRYSVASCLNMFEVDGKVEETGSGFHLERVPRNNQPSTSSPHRNDNEVNEVEMAEANGSCGSALINEQDEQNGRDDNNITDATNSNNDEVNEENEVEMAENSGNHASALMNGQDGRDDNNITDTNNSNNDEVNEENEVEMAENSGNHASALMNGQDGRDDNNITDTNNSNNDEVNEENEVEMTENSVSAQGEDGHGENSKIGQNNHTQIIVAADGRHGHIGRSIVYDPFMRTRNVPFHIAGRRNSISVFNTIDEH